MFRGMESGFVKNTTKADDNVPLFHCYRLNREPAPTQQFHVGKHWVPFDFFQRHVMREWFI
jgi:hypothetical protein